MTASYRPSAPDPDGGQAALEVFVRFSEAANLLQDPAALMALAEDIHASTFPQHDPPVFVVASYTRGVSSWTMSSYRGEFPPGTLAAVQAGLPLGIQPMKQMLQEQRAVLVEWTPDQAVQEQIPDSAVFHTSGLYPLFRHGEIMA